MRNARLHRTLYAARHHQRNPRRLRQAPHRALGQAGSFAGIILADTYNKRLQPNELKASSSAGTAMDLTYSFVDANSHNSGNVIGITNNKDTTRSQSFTYDQVNRLAIADTSATTGSNCWGETYSYDQWANMTSIAAMSGYTGCTQESGLSVTALTNNQLSATGFAYDAAGNMTGDGAYTYGFNAESEIKSAAGVNYTYDGDGNSDFWSPVDSVGVLTPDRVQKSNGKIYWYGAGTEILDESDSSGNITDEYVFFGSKRRVSGFVLANPDSNCHRVASSGAISYYAEDLLGSSRVITTSAGSVCGVHPERSRREADFYPGVYPQQSRGSGAPFASRVTLRDERVITNTCLPAVAGARNYKFEGRVSGFVLANPELNKERDTETSNDDFGARYYSSRLGRWLSADWSSVPAPVPYANLTNPQTLNLYAMVRDNPETFADLDGHFGSQAECAVTMEVDEELQQDGWLTHHTDLSQNGAEDARAYYYEKSDEEDERAAANGQASLTVSMSQGTANPTGVDFSRGEGIGPVNSPGQGWYYNVLLTGTLDAGVDASQYQIQQTVKIKGSEVTEDGKKYSLGDKRAETIAPADTSYWKVIANKIYGLDSPGLRNVGANDQFVKSATLTMHFESRVTKGKARVSPVVKWDVRIKVVNFEGSISGGVE